MLSIATHGFFTVPTNRSAFSNIRWLPSSDPDVAGYIVFSGLHFNGPFGEAINIPANQGGPNFDGTFYFFTDTFGTVSTWYEIVSYDDVGRQSPPSTPFQITGSGIPNTLNVPINENYGGTLALQVLDSSGNPVNEASIKVFFTTDYLSSNFNSPIGNTFTKSDGTWDTTIYVQSGASYTILFEKEQSFSPSTVVVVV